MNQHATAGSGLVRGVLFLQSFPSSVLTKVVRCRVELFGDAGGGAQHFDPPVMNDIVVVVDANSHVRNIKNELVSPVESVLALCSEEVDVVLEP